MRKNSSLFEQKLAKNTYKPKIAKDLFPKVCKLKRNGENVEDAQKRPGWPGNEALRSIGFFKRLVDENLRISTADIGTEAKEISKIYILPFFLIFSDPCLTKATDPKPLIINRQQLYRKCALRKGFETAPHFVRETTVSQHNHRLYIHLIIFL